MIKLLNSSLLASLFVISVFAQTIGTKNTSHQPDNYIAPPVIITPSGTTNDAGPLLTNGILVTTFPDYTGAATPMGIAFDGTYYYVIPGGFSSDVVAQLDVNFNLVSTATVGLDMRSVFYNSVDGDIYIKGYTSNGLYRLHTSPFDGSYDIIFTNIFQDPQTKAVATWDGSKIYDQLDGSAKSYDFATGTVTSTFTLNLQHDLTWPRGNLLAYTGSYLLTYAHPVVYAYDATNGNYISSCTLGSQPSSDEWSMCYTNGYFMVTDASDANWYVWTIDQGVPVELTSFIAAAGNNQTELNWSTATEKNNQGFEIQRKSVQSVYEKIGFVAGFGTTTEPKTYSYIDSNVPDGNYSYRLKQIDFDGSYKYSNEVNVDVSSPAEFELSQNYPNPFNPSTTIKYSIPENTFVTLTVFNSLGEKVKTLVNEVQNSGTYKISFDASDLPSGNYIYQLRTGAGSLTEKMILLK